MADPSSDRSSRNVVVLGCRAGVWMNDGQAISVVHLGVGDEVGQITLDLSDTKRLLVGLLRSLHDHDQEKTLHQWLWEDGDTDEEDPPPGAVHGGRFLFPPTLGTDPPSPPPAQSHSTRQRSKRPRPVQRPPTGNEPSRSGRPFGRALPDRPVKVRFEGETVNRRFGFLGAFEMQDALLLVCRRWRPSPTGGRTSDDFLLKVLQPLPRDRRAVFCGRRLGGKDGRMVVSDVAWLRMDRTAVGKRVVVNGVALVRIDIWVAWDLCRRRIFRAGCRWDEWA